MQTIRFGIIGCGLMGREFASAISRWCHLQEARLRPTLVAVCNPSPAPMGWFRDNFPGIRQATADYRELLANPQVEAVYVAVPHHLHAEIYCAAIEAGKHLMGEKPFGIDREANEAILRCLAAHPSCFARCSSEFPFFPAMQRIGRLLEDESLGRILEANAAFLHSSDLDPGKPINWKRRVATNGAYGCLGDLGLHTLHVPLRAGWKVRNVRAILTRIYPERPGLDGVPVACETWDNATLLCEAEANQAPFPLTIRTHRIAPGEKNTWSFEILGTSRSARFTTKHPKTLQLLEYSGGEQAWQHLDLGYETAFPTITGSIFEPGFPDVLLQMWASFLQEMDRGSTPGRFAACVTPEETRLHHQILTAALQSHLTNRLVSPEIC